MVFPLVVLAIGVGALLQRVTGMGFALAVAPFLVLLLGPFDGVMVVNLCGMVTTSLILTRLWRLVEWRRWVMLVVPAVIGAVPASYLASTLPGPVLEIGIAVLLLIGLTVSLVVSRSSVVVSGLAPAVVSGFSSGFMNASAGIGGPAIAAYAVLTRWPQDRFAATLQPYFLVVTAVSLAGKLLFSGGRLPELEWWQWLCLLGALLLGIVAGELVARRVSGSTVRIAVVVIAFAGGVIALVHGILDAVA